MNLVNEGVLPPNEPDDRDEAAWKRQEQCYLDQMRDAVNMIGHERFVKEHSQVGNAAALREALEAVDKIYDMLSKPFVVIEEVRHACQKARAVLISTPQRNCDMPYYDRVEMYGAFKDWCKAKGHTMEPMLAYDAFDWLLAPAAEQEGGAK